MTPVPFKRLLIFIHSMSGGGAERVAASLANHWAEKGVEITLVTLTDRNLDFYVLHSMVKRVTLNLAGNNAGLLGGLWHNLRRTVALRGVLRRTQPDIALGIMTTANVLLAWSSLGLGVRTVGSEHVHPPKFPLSIQWEVLRRRSYGLLNAVIALTSESACWIRSHTNARQVTVIPNAAPWPLPAFEPKVSPESVCSPTRKILLAVGRFEIQKGFDLLVDMFAGVMQRHPAWDLVILGEGSMYAMIEHRVHRAGLGGRIFLPGRVGNLGEWYKRADLYVMSSRFEGFGNTLAEALTHGLPAVSFDCDTGPRDILRHEVDGLLVAPGDVLSLSAAVDQLMGDDDMRKRFAERAVEARERFSVERVTGMWEKLFAKIMK